MSRGDSRIKADVRPSRWWIYQRRKIHPFNQITEARVYAADQLFATLDPRCVALTWRSRGDRAGGYRWVYPSSSGTDLVAAFKATLQETRQATLLLHVVDAAMCAQENIDAVDTVLEEIDAHEIPSLMVMNKIDMLDDFEPRIDRDEENKTDSCLAFRADRG